MRILVKFAAIILASLILSACYGNPSQNYQSMDSDQSAAPLIPAPPQVKTFSQEENDGHRCTVIYRCVIGSLTTSQYCASVEFVFDVKDADTAQILVKGAKSYWQEVPRGITQVEWGINNKVTSPLLFTSPSVVTCLASKPDSQSSRAIFDFPSSYCSPGMTLACSSIAMSGWEIDTYNDYTPVEPWGYGGDDGSTVVCNDGWISNSGGKQGACSHHGGVSG